MIGFIFNHLFLFLLQAAKIKTSFVVNEQKQHLAPCLQPHAQNNAFVSIIS